MRDLATLLTIAVFLLTLLDAPLQSGGWLWDSANALGFLAFGGFLYLFIDVGSGARQRIHKIISYAVAGALAGHVALGLSSDVLCPCPDLP